MTNQSIFLRVVKNGKPVEMKQVNDQQIVIGREGEVTLAVNDPQTAPIHAMIENRDGKYFLCDLGTEFGTYFKGEKIVETELKTGDEFKIGETVVEFHVGIPKPFKGAGGPVTMPASAPPPPTAKHTPPPMATKLTPSKPASYTPPPQSVKQAKSENKIIPPPAKSKNQTSPGLGGLATSPFIKNPQRPAKGTFAPPSSGNVREALKAGQGNVVEVVILWKDRILATHHFERQKVVTVGTHPKNDIILPVFGSVRVSHPLINLEAGTKVILTTDMTGDVVKKDGSKANFEDLKRLGTMVAMGAQYVYTLGQNEVMRVSFGEGVELVIRFVGSPPATRLSPIFNLTVNQLTGLVIGMLATFLFLFYVFLYAPPAPEKKVEETIPPRKAQFFYKKKVEEITPTEVAPMPKNAAETIKDKQVAPERGEEGAAQEAKPNKSKSQVQKLTSDKPGKDKGIQKAATNKAKDSGAKSNVKDVSKSGILGVFGTKGTQDQLNKAFQGSGNVAGAAQGATGSGAEAAGAGNVAGNGLKEIGKGGNGTATVGIAGLNTKGKGGGVTGYGTAGLGAKKNASIIAGDENATFTGTIDREAIRRVVQANIKQIKACYERGLNKDPGLYGKIVIQWTIGSGGRVLEAGIKNTTMNSSEVENCAVSRLRTWKFPEPPVNEVAVVSYPFVFQAQE